jgi:hypothetical protein
MKRTPKLAKDELAEKYNKFKKYEGKQYTGMPVGKSHKWYYDKGEWHETKITPDVWSISYAVTKRRAGKAPEGSGVPVGSGYHWFIVAHQQVMKLNGDDYSTEMGGLKFKLAHKRASKQSWNASVHAQRKSLIQYLEHFIKQLKQNPLQLEFDYRDEHYEGEALPILEACVNGECHQFEVTLNNEFAGIFRKMKSGWKLSGADDPAFVRAVGKALDTQMTNK